MKLTGYEKIDSEKNGKSVHGVVLHRRVPCSGFNCSGFKSSSIFISDRTLSDIGLSFEDIVNGFNVEKDFIIETVKQGNFENVQNILIL